MLSLGVSACFSLFSFLYLALVFSSVNLFPLASLYASKNNTTACKCQVKNRKRKPREVFDFEEQGPEGSAKKNRITLSGGCRDDGQAAGGDGGGGGEGGRDVMSKIHRGQDLKMDDAQDREEAVLNQQKKRNEGGGGQGGGGVLVHKRAMKAPAVFVHKIPAMMKGRAEGRVNRVGSFEQVLRRLEVCVPRCMTHFL